MKVQFVLHASRESGFPSLEGSVQRDASLSQVKKTIRQRAPVLSQANVEVLAGRVFERLQVLSSESNRMDVHIAHSDVHRMLPEGRALSATVPPLPQEGAPVAPMTEQDELAAKQLRASSYLVNQVATASEESGRLPELSLNVESRIDKGQEVFDIELSRRPTDANFPSGYRCEVSLVPPGAGTLGLHSNAESEFHRVDLSNEIMFDLAQGSSGRLPTSWKFELVDIPHPSRELAGVTVRMRVVSPSGRVENQKEHFIAGPAWIMSNHLMPVREVVVVQKTFLLSAPPIPNLPPVPPKLVDDADCAQYLRELTHAIPSTRIKVVRMQGEVKDTWVRDMVFSGRSLATTGAILDSSELMLNPVRRETRGYDEVIAELDRHCISSGKPLVTIGEQEEMKSDLESGGNFLCTPPIGEKFPFGAILVGSDADREMGKTTLDFLRAQQRQPLVRIDTSWLQTGHTDELVTFVPWPGATYGFKALIANHELAMKLMGECAQQRMCVGVEDGFKEKFQRLGEVMDLVDFRVGRLLEIQSEVGGLMQAAKEVVPRLESLRRVLEEELGLGDEDIVDLPVLFRRRTRDDSFSLGGFGPQERLGYQPLCPNPVNMLVATQTSAHAVLCIPKPFGPLRGEGSGALCIFEEYIRRTLSSSHNSIRFINDYQANHVNGGNIHCSTAELR